MLMLQEENVSLESWNDESSEQEKVADHVNHKCDDNEQQALAVGLKDQGDSAEQDDCHKVIFVGMFIALPVFVILAVLYSLEESYLESSSSNDGIVELPDTSSHIFIYPDYSEEAFTDPYSPQSRAYDWLIHDPAFHEYSVPRILQRFALVTLFMSTNGVVWSRWNHSLFSYDYSECYWFSFPDNACVDFEYMYLRLPNNNLLGTIPPELALLTSLVEIDLEENHLVGTIPTQIESLTKLQRLNIHDNSLSGTLPKQLGSLTSLQTLRLAKNEIDGAIPSHIGRLRNLRRMNVGSNSITGTLPTELGTLYNAFYLFFSYNKITGTIPSTLGFLTDLELLYLNGNPIDGTIPSTMGLCHSLHFLQLGNTTLTGSVPSELCQLHGDTRLQDLTVDCDQVKCDCDCDCH